MADPFPELLSSLSFSSLAPIPFVGLSALLILILVWLCLWRVGVQCFDIDNNNDIRLVVHHLFCGPSLAHLTAMTVIYRLQTVCQWHLMRWLGPFQRPAVPATRAGLPLYLQPTNGSCPCLCPPARPACGSAKQCPIHANLDTPIQSS